MAGFSENLSFFLRTLHFSWPKVCYGSARPCACCSDLRAGSAEVTAEIASSQVHVLELQVMKTTRLGRRLASRVHKEQMVQQMPSRATALCSLVVDASQVCA